MVKRQADRLRQVLESLQIDVDTVSRNDPLHAQLISMGTEMWVRNDAVAVKEEHGPDEESMLENITPLDIACVIAQAGALLVIAGDTISEMVMESIEERADEDEQENMERLFEFFFDGFQAAIAFLMGACIAAGELALMPTELDEGV